METKKKLICKTGYPVIKVEKLGSYVNDQIVEVDMQTAEKLLSTGCFSEIKEEKKSIKGGK